MAINFGAVDPMAMAKGAASTNAMLQAFAQKRAGNLLSQGDRAGATQTLQQEGLTDDAFDLETKLDAQDTRLHSMDAAKKKEQLEMITDVATSLQQISKTQGREAVLPAFDQLAPVFKQQGASDEELAMYRAQLAQDPDTFLDGIIGLAGKAAKQYTLGPGSQLVDDKGKMLASAPFAPIVRTVGADQSLVGVGLPPGGAAPVVGDPFAPASDAPPGAAAPSGPLPAIEDFAKTITEMVPGAQITSMRRTPAHNTEVGGAPNSFHLRGQAVDFVKPEGFDLAQFRQQLEASGVLVAELLDEGDHIHVAIGQKGKAAAPTEVAAAPGAATAGPGATVLATGPAKKPSETWTNLSPAELKAGGYAAGSVVQRNSAGQEQVRQAPPKAASNAGGGGSVKVSPQDNRYVVDLRKSVDQARTMSNLLDEFVGLNKEINTGGMMAVPGIADAQIPFNPRLARMRSITSQLTPAMRNGLPGAASDKDVSMFRQATVGLDKPRETNLSIARAAKAFAQRQGDFVAFMEGYLKNNGTLLGAQEDWSRYADSQPIFVAGKGGMPIPRKAVPWREFFKNEGSAPASAPKPAAPGTVRKWTAEGGIQ